MSQRFLFLDWISLREPALPIDDKLRVTKRFVRGMNKEEIRVICGEFTAKIEGIDARDILTWSQEAAAPTAFITDYRRLLLNDPSAAVVAEYLNESVELTRAVGVSLSRSGFIAVAVECEDSGDKEHRDLMRDKAESVAALVVRLVGIAVSGKSPQRGLELSGANDAKHFLVSPLAIMPVAVECQELPADEVDLLAEAALAAGTLKELEIEKETSKGSLLESGSALDAIAQRYAAAAEQTIRQIEAATLPPEDATPTTPGVKNETTDGYEVLRKIARVLSRSTIFLCLVFFTIIFLPSLDLINNSLKPYLPNHKAVPWLFSLFFVLALIISVAVLGLERLFDHRPQDDTIRVWNPLGSAFWARILFHSWWVLPAIVLGFLSWAFAAFWLSRWLGITLHPPLSFLAPGSDSTFAVILNGIIWAAPALAIGLLKFSHDRLAGIVIGTQEDSRYQSFLEKFDPVLAAAELYSKQLRNTEVVKSKPRQLPDFGAIRNRIALVRARLSKEIEQAKTRFNRSAAATVVMAGAIAAIPGLTEIEPDGREEQVHLALASGFLEGKDNSWEEANCKILNDDCKTNEWIAWSLGRSIGSQSRSFQGLQSEVEKINLYLAETGPNPPERLKKSIAGALKDDELLRSALSEALKDAVKDLPETLPDKLEMIIGNAVAEALKNDGKQATINALTEGNLLKNVIATALREGPVIPMDRLEAAIKSGVAEALKKEGKQATIEALTEEDRLKTVISAALKELPDIPMDRLETAIRSGVAEALKKEGKQATIDALIEDDRLKKVIATALKELPDVPMDKLEAAIRRAVSVALTNEGKQATANALTEGNLLQNAITEAVTKVPDLSWPMLRVMIGNAASEALRAERQKSDPTIGERNLLENTIIVVMVKLIPGLKREDLNALVAHAVSEALKAKGGQTASDVGTEDELLAKAIATGVIEALRRWNGGDLRQTGNVDAKELAKAILEAFKEDSFPVLPALPTPCRQEDRLFASVYFARSKASWSQAVCVKIDDHPAHRLEHNERGQVAANDSIAACAEGELSDVETAKRDLSSAIMSRLETTPSVKQILVVGYADSTGPVNSNIRISNDRAVAVAEYLRSKLRGKTPDVPISAVGRSEVSLAGEFRAGGLGGDPGLYESGASRVAEIRLCFPETDNKSEGAGERKAQR